MRWAQRGNRALRRWGADSYRDRGAVTAEFAIVLLAVLMVFGLVIGALLLTTQRLVLTSGAADVACLEARGDTAQAAARISELGRASALNETPAVLCTA